VSMSDSVRASRARLDLAAPLAPAPDTSDDPTPTRTERVLVIGGLWVLPAINTVLLVAALLVLLR
jgi:hypothetical protein